MKEFLGVALFIFGAYGVIYLTCVILVKLS